MPGKKTLLIAAALCCQLLPAQKTRFVAPDVGTSMRVISRKISDNLSSPVFNTGPMFGLNASGSVNTGSNGYPADTVFIGIDSGYYKCKTEETLVLMEHDRLMSKTEIVSLDQVRAGKRRVVLTRLAPRPVRAKDDAYLATGNVEIRLARKSFIQRYYDSYADYRAKKVEHSFISERELSVKRSAFAGDIDDFLVTTKHLDTTGKLNLNIYDNIKFDVTVTSIIEHKFPPFCVVETRCTVKFPDYFGASRERSYTSFGNIGYDGSAEDALNNVALTASALQQLVVKILEDPQLTPYLKNVEKELKKQTEFSDEIVLSNTSKEATNLESATNAVVTVTQKNGHGSGCILSNDGYIVTNYHVVGVDTSDIYAIFNGGVKKRCRFVRGNPIYDLALLKADTTISMPLRLSASKNISVGADVYAIGTPRDISLGQSITRGIISARRIIENKTYIQSDVSVNSGNSGGALTNKEGELIGIVNAKLVGYGVEGVSFAIPAYYIGEFLKVKIVN